jgi:hypothetical protein
LLVEFEQEYQQVRVEGAQVTSHSANRATLEFERGRLAASELINRLSMRYRIRDLEMREPDLEATIRRIYDLQSQFKSPLSLLPLQNRAGYNRALAAEFHLDAIIGQLAQEANEGGFIALGAGPLAG